MTVRSFALLAFCLNAVACFSGFENSDIRCQNNAQCPKGQNCSIPTGREYGACVSETSTTGGKGGASTGVGATGGSRSSTTATGAKAPGSSHSSSGGVGLVTSTGGSGGAVAGTTTNGGSAGSESTTSTGGTTPATGSSGGNQDGGVRPTDAPALLLSNGASCNAGSECESGLCVESVCCDGKCDGQCESCKQTGALGTCKTVKGNPISGKTACAGNGTCQGQCDGSNGKTCSYPGGTTICTAASCKDGKATPASVCDGLGACTTPGSNTCPSNLCSSDGSKCQDSCTDGNCGGDMYCSSTGVCLARKKAGEKCTIKDECASGVCADGVCCATACGGQCQACNETGKVGTCTRITGAPRGTRTPCTSTVATCGGTCDGSSDTKCAYPGAEKTCTAAKCSTDLATATSASACNEAGACTAAQTINCGASGSYCASGACTTKLPPGGSCTGNLQCASGNCSNNTCCAAGLTWCGGACVDLQTSNAHCGACNRACGSQQCMAGLCCDANSVKCGSSCCGPNHKCSNNVCSCTGTTLSCGQCGSWGFDSGPSSTEGWIDPDSSSSGITSLAINNDHVYEGKYSLAVGFVKNARVEVKPCPSRVSLANYKLTARVSLVGTGMPAEGCYVYLNFASYPGFINVLTYGDSWVELPYSFPESPTNEESFIGVSTYCDGFAGTLYIDSVTLTP